MYERSTHCNVGEAAKLRQRLEGLASRYLTECTVRESAAARLSELEIENQALRSAIHAIHASRSWRMIHRIKQICRMARRLSLRKEGSDGAPLQVPSGRPESRPCPTNFDRVGDPRIPSEHKFRVAFVVRTGVYDAASMRYRGFNIIEAVREAGVEAASFDEPKVLDSISEVLTYDLIVLVRRPFSEVVSQLFSVAKAHQIPVICDVDDYLFDDSVIPHIAAGVGSGWIDAYRQTLLAASYFTAPNQYLVDRATVVGREGFVIRNGFNRAQLAFSEQVDARPKDGRVRLGYFSGSRTHQADFRQIAQVLLRLMTDCPEVDLTVAGDFDLAEFHEFGRLNGRVFSRPFVPWTDLAKEIAAVDINLVPLEINLFTEAKSNLKYYEAALHRIPTVATPTVSFVNSISHGENGLLAKSPDEWYSALRSLVDSPELRRKIGESAYRDAIQQYAPSKVREESLMAYRMAIRDHRASLRVPADTLTAVVAVTDFNRAVRDRTPALLLAAEFARRGVSVTLLILEGGATAHEADRILAGCLAEPSFAIQAGNEIPCADLLVAGDSQAAHRVASVAYRARKSVYVPPDYDVAGLPVGNLQQTAHRSFELGLPIYTHDPASVTLIQRLHPTAEVNLLPRWRTESRQPSMRLDRPTGLAVLASGPILPAVWKNIVEAIHKVLLEFPDLPVNFVGQTVPESLAVGLPQSIVSRPEHDSFTPNNRQICMVVYSAITPVWVTGLMARTLPTVLIATDPRLPTVVDCSEIGVLQVPAEPSRIASAVAGLLDDTVQYSKLILRMAEQASKIPESDVAVSHLFAGLKATSGRFIGGIAQSD